MLGASEKIALLGRQNEALLHSSQMLEEENSELRSEMLRYRAEAEQARRTIPSTPKRRGSDSAQGSYRILYLEYMLLVHGS